MNAASTTLRATSRGDGPTAAWAVFRALERRFRRGELITLDGATGTELTKHSRVTGEEQWNGLLLLSLPVPLLLPAPPSPTRSLGTTASSSARLTVVTLPK